MTIREDAACSSLPPADSTATRQSGWSASGTPAWFRCSEPSRPDGPERRRTLELRSFRRCLHRHHKEATLSSREVLEAVSPSGSGIPSAVHWDSVLAHLARASGTPCEGEAVRRAAVAAGSLDDEPMARLIAGARELRIQITPARMTIAAALWTADVRTPLVVWSEPEGRWLLVRRFGPLRARVSALDAPLEARATGRRALARRLGLAGPDETIEVGFVMSPAFVSHAPAGHDGHGTGHGPSPVRRYLSVIRPEAPEIFAIVSFSIVTGLLYLALPLAVNAFVSNLSFGNQSTPFLQALLFLGIALFAALALSAIIRALQMYTAEVIKRRLFVRLVGDLTYRLPRVGGLAFEGTHAPELVNRFLDIVTVQSATERILMSGIPVVLGVVIGSIVLGLYHPTLFAFAIALWMVLGIAIVAGRGAVDASIRESRIKYETVGWLEELARAPTLFKGPGGSAFAEQRSDAIARRYLDARKQFFFLLMRQIGTLLALEIFATAALLTVGGWLVLEQQLTLGQLVASELIVTSIVYSISRLGSIFDSWYSGLAAVDKIGHLTDLELERIGGDAPTVTEQGMDVSCRSVCFTYPSGRTVLSGLDLAIGPGECVALWGPYGRGSSTLLNLLFGLVKPDSGFIALDGLDVRSWSLETLRSRVCLIRPDDLVAGSLLENVRLGRDDIGIETVSAALAAVDLLDDALSLPQGLDTPLISGGLPLSSRQRLRLLIARAIVLSPSLLLLDDLVDGMDPETQREIFTALRDPRRQWTVIVTTRDPSVAELCGRFVEISAEGRALAEPTLRTRATGS